MVLQEALEDRARTRLELAQHHLIGRICALLDDGLEIVFEVVPFLGVDEQLENRARLVPPRCEVVLGVTPEGHRRLAVGVVPFDRVDGSRGQRRRDFAARKVDHGGAHPGQDLGGNAGHAHLQALVVVDGADFLLRPTAVLGAGVATDQELAPELIAVQFVAKRAAAAEMVPSVVLQRRKSVRNVAHELRGRRLAFPVIRRSVPHLHRSRRDGVDRLERRHHLARSVELNGEPATRAFGHLIGEILGPGAEAGQVLGPRRDQPPLPQLRRDSRLWKCRSRGNRGDRRGACQ